MASAILSAFPPPPTHIPTTPLPPTPGSGSRPPTPSGRRTPGGAGDKSFGTPPQPQQPGSLPFSSTPDLDGTGANTTQRREKRRSRGMSVGARSSGEGVGVPRLSLESTGAVGFGENKEGKRMIIGSGDASPLESTFSHTTQVTTAFGGGVGGGDRRSSGGGGGDSRRMSHYENLRRSLYGPDGGGSSRGSHYSTGTGEGAVSTSGSSSLGGLGVTTPGSAFSSRPGSFIGPGTPPLNVPLSASARLAALRAKRAGLGALTLNGSASTPSTPASHYTTLGVAGPPPTTPLPPIPTSISSSDTEKGRKMNNRRSINLPSPVISSYPFPSARDKDSEVATPTTATHTSFHRSSPSGATFGHGIGGGGGYAMRDGYHSRGSSFGSNMESFNGLAPSSFRATMRLGMNMPNSSVSTFGGVKNASTSSFGDDGSSGGNAESTVGGGNGGGGRYRHSTSYSTSTTTSTGTAAAGNGRRSPRESFGPGLAVIAALSRGELPGGSVSPNSQYSDPNSGSHSGKSSAYGGNFGSNTTTTTQPPPASAVAASFLHNEEDDGGLPPIDVQKELEALRREKADRRVSTASMMSNFSTRTTNTFRGAASRVMDVSPDEVRDDEAAELAGERLLGSVGDGFGLEGLAAFGKRKGLGFGVGRLGNSSGGPGSRPGSSKGPPGSPSSQPGSSRGPAGPSGLGREKGTPPLSTATTSSDPPRLSSSGFQSNSTLPFAVSGASTPSVYSSVEEDADRTITISRDRSAQARYGRRASDEDTMERFDTGIGGPEAVSNARTSAEMESRTSNGSTISSQHHLMMKKGSSREVPTVKVEENGGRTPLVLKKVRTSGTSSWVAQYRGFHDPNRTEDQADDSGRLINIAVWNDAPATPLSGDFHSPVGLSGELEDGGGGGRQQLASDPTSSARQESDTLSGGPVLDVTGTPRQVRSPSPSNTSISHATITPFSRGNKAGSSISSGKPSLDIDRPDSPISAASSSRRHFVPPPALSISRATPHSSEVSLVMPEDKGEEEEILLASPSAGRDRANHGNKRDGPPPPVAASTTRKSHRASEDFAIKMEKEMEEGGMRGEFALLQEVTIREKRLKLALFGRGAMPSTLTKPGSRRPQSMVTIEKPLPPDSPDGGRTDGASSPEIGDMIRRSRKSLNTRAMRRRRSTGALSGYAGDQWRRSEVEMALGVTPRRPSYDQEGGGRRAMELDRSGVRVRDSIVLDLPPEEHNSEQEVGQDAGAESDSSLDLHTPLPRLMLRAGLLSPHSKVLRPPTPEEESRSSMLMKNGLKVPYDKRNTDKRKRRHRDGKLLREGVGLTTGLGWSDSEDEDAPSPLTRRLSSMTLTSSLSRKASMASSINSFATPSMNSLNLSRSPSLPSIPAGSVVSKTPVAAKHNSDFGTDPTSRHSGPPSKAMVITGRNPFSKPPEPTPRSALKSSATMSIIEHAQMLPTASLFTSKNHPLASSARRGTFNFSAGNRRSSSPAGNSSQSSNGGVVFPVTPDADLPPALSNSGSSSMLKEVSTPEDVQGVSGGTSMGLNPTSYSGAGTGLAGLSASRGRSWTTPHSPTPAGAAILPESDEPTPARPRPAEVRYSGGNFSYPTNMRPAPVPVPTQNTPAPPTTITPVGSQSAAPTTPQLKKSDGLRKPTPRGLQPLTLPTVVHAGGRLSPRAGTFALPSAPSLNQSNPTTPGKTNLPLPGMLVSKSSGNIASAAAPSNSSQRDRSGSTSSTGGPAAFAPSKVSSRMPQPSRTRTLSGGGSTPIPAPVPPLPQATSPPNSTAFPTTPVPSASKKAVGALKSFVGSRSASEGTSAVPKMLGIARTTSAPGSPPVRIGGAGHGKTGSGMTYRKSAGSALEAVTSTPPRSRIALPASTPPSRLVAPSSFTLHKTASTTSLTSSVVGVAL